ncbi:MAG TPA: hypothetical protein VHG92_05975 [Afifellaceae bacterium]|nr:hypothetical protein [Afifellaceae bacterium]
MVTSPTPSVPAAPEQPAIVFVALEPSKARWLVGIHAPVADKISRHGVAGGDSQALLELIARARRRTEQQLGRPAAVVCCYEAGYDGFWLHRLLCAGGMAT